MTRYLVPPAGTALLLIDVINDLAFKGSEKLVAQAESMAVKLAAFKRRAAAANVPCIYVNDNFGQWRSDFRWTVAHCTARSSRGRRVSRRLSPKARDYFVLKPKHSGFFDTTLDTLLETLRIRRVILTGIAGNICVLFTANDAYMRELRIFAPAGLHRLEHTGGERSCAAADRRRAQGQRRAIGAADVPPAQRATEEVGRRRPQSMCRTTFSQPSSLFRNMR